MGHTSRAHGGDCWGTHEQDTQVGPWRGHRWDMSGTHGQDRQVGQGGETLLGHRWDQGTQVGHMSGTVVGQRGDTRVPWMGHVVGCCCGVWFVTPHPVGHKTSGWHWGCDKQAQPHVPSAPSACPRPSVPALPAHPSPSDLPLFNPILNVSPHGDSHRCHVPIPQAEPELGCSPGWGDRRGHRGQGGHSGGVPGAEPGLRDKQTPHV